MFDMFTSQPAVPATPTVAAPTPPVGPTPPGNLPAVPAVATEQNPGTAANGVVPAQPATSTDLTAPAPGAEENKSPLAEYATLWDDVPKKEGDPDPAAPVTSLDPAKLQEIVSKVDFSKSLNQENLAKIAAGGEEATAAFASSMNEVAQQVLIQATLAANKMTEQAVSAAVEAQNAKIPELIRSATTSAALIKANPLFQDPAIKPVIDAVKSQLAEKNPTATPDQLTEMAQNFVSVMGEQLAPKKPSTESNVLGQPPQDATDWNKFLTG